MSKDRSSETNTWRNVTIQIPAKEYVAIKAHCDLMKPPMSVGDHIRMGYWLYVKAELKAFMEKDETAVEAGLVPPDAVEAGANETVAWEEKGGDTNGNNNTGTV